MLGKQPPIANYKDGHKDRGDRYDGALQADPFDAFLTRWEILAIRSMLGRHFATGIGRYMDFACGTGRITEIITAHARETVGVDISDSMLQIARGKLPNATFICADLTTQSLSIGPFDLVSSFRFFGNADPGLRDAALGAISGLVRPGGYLLVNNHRNPNALMNITARIGGQELALDLTWARFQKLLRRHGFRLVDARPIGVWMYRSAIAAMAGRDAAKEARLEAAFDSRIWCRMAPDSVILMQKSAG